MTTRQAAVLLGVLVSAAVACSAGGSPVLATTPTPVPIQPTALPPTSTAAPPTLTPAPTANPTPTFTATPAPSPTPFGCGARPADDFTRVPIYGWVVNQRTLSMLGEAQKLYGGPNDLRLSISQGSYHPGVSASFGTHDGGGVVDLSVYNQGAEAGLLDEAQIDALVLALRRAGFAAWYRATDDLYSGSPPHIHAVAVGDAELSDAAQEQLTGENGYFRGRDGLPGERGGPDRHGGPVVCPWMVEMGYADLRQE